jgi:hypothetical protein
MAGRKQSGKGIYRGKTALFLVEGETEVLFYDKILENYAPRISRRIVNLKGNFNINNKIIDASLNFGRNNPDVKFEVFVCLDQERIGSPPYNHSYCLAEISKNEPDFQQLHGVVVTLMLESILFLDIAGIFAFLRVPTHRRSFSKFKNFRNLTHRDMSRLFDSAGKIYRKGKKCESFLESLDFEVIATAKEIKQLLFKLKEIE